MSVLQSGSVTPGHIATWTTDGVIQDSGVSIPSISGILSSSKLQINFNSGNTDNPIQIGLPPGFTRYRVNKILISGAASAVNSATCGVFTAQSAGGVAVVTGATAVTVSQTAPDTNNNMQSLSINDQDTMFFSDPVLYFRVQNPEGIAALANVTVFYEPLP